MLQDDGSLVSSGFANRGFHIAWLAGPEKKSSLSSLDWSKASGMLHMIGSDLSRERPPDTSNNHGPLSGQDVDVNGFSSSLPQLLHGKLKVGDQTVNIRTSEIDGEPVDDAFALLDEELVSRAIGDLLPDDEEELLAGITDGFAIISMNPTSEENEDFDLFGNVGGLELDGEPQDCFGMYANTSRAMDGFYSSATSFQGLSNGPGTVIGEHPYGEHPSRTLFVRNINSNVEDSELRALFEQYGDIRTLYTACKHRGFVMISYYDIRAARSAMRALQNKPLRRRKLDIHFSIPKDNPSDKDINQGTLVVFNLDASVSNDDLRQIFGQYGEVKEIRETPHKRHHKFIEFYDVRAAEAALRALNRSDIAGKRIKLEPSRPGGARRSLTQQLSQELEEEARLFWQQSSPPVANSPPGHLSAWGHYGSPVEHGPPRSLHNSLGALLPSVNKPLPIPLHPTSLRSGARGSHLGRHGQVDGSSPSMHTGLGIKGVPAHHAHSLPDLGNSMMPLYSPPAPLPIRGAAAAQGLHEGIDGVRPSRATSGPGSDVSLFEHAAGGLGITSSGSLKHHSGSASGSSSLSGPQFLWGNSGPYQQASSSVVWSTPPLSHSFTPPGHGQPQPFGFTGSHDHFGSTSLPSHRFHAGSAPSGDPSVLERQFGYPREASDALFFGPGSLGVPGSSGAVLMNANTSHNIGNGGAIRTNFGFESSTSMNLGFMSPHQRSHMFTHGSLMPGISDILGERARIRRTESSASQADNKKQYQLDIDRILRGEDNRTTLMIKNIPNKYTSKMLLAAIDENHRGMYDFLYLPIDFKNKCNVGYAFINMTSPAHIISLYEAFNGKKWEKFNSEKVASLAYARIQGKAALVAHFQNSSLMNEDKRCRPILFHSEGPEIADQDQSLLQARANRDPVEIGDFLETASGLSNQDDSAIGSAGSSSRVLVSGSQDLEFSFSST